MGNKIPLAEPDSGEALNTTKVNNDIGNWRMFYDIVCATDLL